MSRSLFCDIYDSKAELTEKVAMKFEWENRALLAKINFDKDDLIQMVLIKFYKYEAESFLEHCKDDRYWVRMLKTQFRFVMLQEYRKAEYYLWKVELDKADFEVSLDEEDEVAEKYAYLIELVSHEETMLWLQGYTKRAIGLKLYGRVDNSGCICRKITKKINEDIFEIQEHLGIRKQPIISEVYKLQDKVLRLHLEGLTNTEIAETLSKTKPQIHNVLYRLRKTGKLDREKSIYFKRKMQILNYLKETEEWTYYRVCKLFNTDTATVKRYINSKEGKEYGIKERAN